MSIKIQKSVAEIKNSLLKMSALVEEAVRTAVRAWQERDELLARRVIDRDYELDRMEVQIGTLVFKTLATQQPMAGDLRMVTAAMQIAEQLERVGDHCVNICDQVEDLVRRTEIDIPPVPDLDEMASMAIKMLSESINAFVYNDTNLAYSVLMQDRNVDDLYDSVMEGEIGSMEASSEKVRAGVYHIVLAINLERIADLATNIAEDVIYLVEGRLIRAGTLSEEELEAAVEGHEPEVPEACPAPAGGRREPLECLENHSRQVHECMTRAYDALKVYLQGDLSGFEDYVQEVSELEHAADLISRNVRSHLPKGIIMPIDKFELFLFLKEQDDIADTAEDMLEWLSYKEVDAPEPVKKDIMELFDLCLGIVERLGPIVVAARTFFQTGDEDVRVHIKEAIRELRSKEHDADVFEHEVKKRLFSMQGDPLSTFHLVRLVELIGASADHAENAADILRSMIAK